MEDLKNLAGSSGTELLNFLREELEYDEDASPRVEHTDYVQVPLYCSRPMLVSKQRYFGSRRNTYCDAESIVLTTRIQPGSDYFNSEFMPTAQVPGSDVQKQSWKDDFTNVNKKPRNKKGRKSFLADKEIRLEQLPFASGKLRQRPHTAGHSVASSLVGISTKPKHNEESLHHKLLKEHRNFMNTLKARRKRRAQLEHRASVLVQKAIRGMLTRKHVKDNHSSFSKENRSRSYKIMDQKIKQDRLRRKNDEERHRASLKIQCRIRVFNARCRFQRVRVSCVDHSKDSAQSTIAKLFRRRIAKRHIGILRLKHQEARMYLVVTRIQAFARQFLAFRRVLFALHARRNVAAFMIQRVTRHYLACKAVRNQRKLIMSMQRDWAATLIQQYGRSVIARSRMTKLRIVRERQLRNCAALFIQCNVRAFFGRCTTALIKYMQVESVRSCAAIKLSCFARKHIIAPNRLQRRKIQCRDDVYYQARVGNGKVVNRLLTMLPGRYNAYSVDRKGNTVLLVASRFGHREIVRNCLLNWHMDIHHANFNGETAVVLATKNAHDELAQYLLLTYDNIHLRFPTLMHHAVARKCKGVFNGLITRGVDVNNRDMSTGRTPLHVAALSLLIPDDDKAEMINLLVQHGAKVNDNKDKDGNTPLHAACQVGSIAATTTLIKLGASPSATNNLNETPWATCLRFGHLECASHCGALEKPPN